MSTAIKVCKNLIPSTRDPFQMIPFPEKLSFWGISLLLFLAPFFRGLFFPEDQRYALVFAVALFWLISLASYLDKNRLFFSDILDYLMLAMPLVYLLSTFTATNYALSVDEVLENLLYFAVFWSVARVIRCTEDIEKILSVIFCSAVLVSLAGLFTASGWLEIKDGFLTNDGGTIASTFQYKNSLASFLIAAAFIGAYLNNQASNLFLRHFISIANFIVLLVLFSTQSHGGYIIFAIFSAVLWLLGPSEKRFRTILSTGMLGLLALVGSKLFLQNIASEAIGLAWGWILLGGVISLSVSLLMEKVQRSGKKLDISLKQMLIAILAISVIVCVLMSTMGIFQLLYEKLHMFGAMERITMYQDGLKMIKEKPLLGWGGGGWSESYTMFQGYGYTVRQTHSYFLQLAIETGLLGLTISVAFWGLFLIKAYKLFKASLEDKELQGLVATLLCSILAIISHAVFDFDLSLAALTITLYALIACLIAINSTQDVNSSKNKKAIIGGWGIKFSLSTIMTLVVVAITLMIASSNNLYKATLKAIQIGDAQNAVKYIDQAIALNPIQSDNYSLAAQLQVALGNPDKAIEYADKAADLLRFNPDKHANIAFIYVKNGENKKAVQEGQKAVELAPLKVAYYEAYASILTDATVNELKAANGKQAEEYIKRTLSIPVEIERAFETVVSEKKQLWLAMYGQSLAVSDKIKLHLGIANLLQGNLDEANKYLTESAQNPEVHKNTIIWQALLAKKQGDNKKADDIIKAAVNENPNIKKQLDELAKLKTISK